jgi:ABC-type Na+ efflux pump permease subunit
MKAVFVPLNFAMIIPILFLQSSFQDPLIRVVFGFSMSMITLKLFPWIVAVKEETKKDSNDSNDFGS